MQLDFELFMTIFTLISAICLCFILLTSEEAFSSNYDPSYKWAPPEPEKESAEEEPKLVPNPPTYTPIEKSQFGLDLESRWLPSVEDTLRIDREVESLHQDIREDVIQYGFHVAEDEQVLSSTHFHRIIRAGGVYLKTTDRVVLTLDIEEMPKSQGCIVKIQVFCRNVDVRMLIFEEVKQMLWQ
ncbi:MAG: hypothetical protein ACFFF4_02710 [Candidatus Thorarchaeota archaeon]